MSKSNAIVARDENGRLIRPDFRSNLPPHLLAAASPADRYIMEEINIARQQNEWLVATTLDLDSRSGRAESDLRELKTLRLILAGKWSMIFSCLVLVVVPAGLVAFGVWLRSIFK